MNRFWQKAKQDPLAATITAIFCLLLYLVLVAIPVLADAEAVKPKLIFTFTVTTWHETTFAGIPFYVECQRQNVDQWFVLKAKRGNQYLPLEGKGFLQAENIVWISWPEEFKTQAQDTLTFELWTSVSDQIGVRRVSLIGDKMFLWRGDTPINPPEE